MVKTSGCNQGEQHYRYVSINALKQERDLLCAYCQSGSKLWGNKRQDTGLEREFIVLLKAKGLLQEFAWQVRPTWCAAAVDFYHFRTHTSVQLDGAGHFTGQWGEARQVILQRDIRICKQAMAGNARLLRIAERDLGDTTLVEAAMSSSHRHFILLSAAFNTVCWQCASTGTMQYYKDVLLEQLGQGRCEVGPQQSILILW